MNGDTVAVLVNGRQDWRVTMTVFLHTVMTMALVHVFCAKPGAVNFQTSQCLL